VGGGVAGAVGPAVADAIEVGRTLVVGETPAPQPAAAPATMALATINAASLRIDLTPRSMFDGHHLPDNGLRDCLGSISRSAPLCWSNTADSDEPAVCPGSGVPTRATLPFGATLVTIKP